MTFSISPATKFNQINWDSFENRPPLDRSMPACSDFNWEYDVACCTDAYVISDTLQMAYERGTDQRAEAKFLSQYPCINSLEFEMFADPLLGDIFIDSKSESSKPSFLQRAADSLKRSVERIFFSLTRTGT